MVLIIAANVPAAFDIPVNNNTCLPLNAYSKTVLEEKTTNMLPLDQILCVWRKDYHEILARE